MKLSFTLFLFLVSLAVHAQSGNIRGHVKDYTGNPLTDAYIFLENSSFGSVSDSRGEFLIRNVPPGSYIISFSAVGFEGQSRQVVVKANETVVVDFQIAEKISVLREIEISGIRSITGMGYLDEVHGTA
ncbi:MAG TPA: carboxypeptidase-like regulatory domain-containing protein, partial [Chryseosolibacter sp.]